MQLQRMCSAAEELNLRGHQQRVGNGVVPEERQDATEAAPLLEAREQRSDARQVLPRSRGEEGAMRWRFSEHILGPFRNGFLLVGATPAFACVMKSLTSSLSACIQTLYKHSCIGLFQEFFAPRALVRLVQTTRGARNCVP